MVRVLKSQLGSAVRRVWGLRGFEGLRVSAARGSKAFVSRNCLEWGLVKTRRQATYNVKPYICRSWLVA